jgi:hypothetical protein
VYEYVKFALAGLEDAIQHANQCLIDPAIHVRVEVSVEFFGGVLHDNGAHLELCD